jgi:RND superfamily putative drug exporter
MPAVVLRAAVFHELVGQMLAIVFGLSMDYEVFLISRIREEYLKDGDTNRAVADGLAKTARVITAAAAIMVVVFLAFVSAPDTFLKLFGIGLASAIFLDATVVRIVLAPAVMQLLGNRNWWSPDWLERILPRLDVERVAVGAEARPWERASAVSCASASSSSSAATSTRCGWRRCSATRCGPVRRCRHPWT